MGFKDECAKTHGLEITLPDPIYIGDFMRICYLAPAFSIHTIRWVNYFAEIGNEIHLISLEKPSTLLDSRVVFHSIASYRDLNNPENEKTSSILVLNKIFSPRISSHLKQNSFIRFFAPVIKKFIFVYNYQFKIHRIIRKIKPDIIHAHYLTVYGLFGILEKFHPICISVWGSDLLIESSHGSMIYGSRYLLRKADAILCDGENIHEAILNHGIPQNRIHLISHGVDINKFSPSKHDPGFMERIFKTRYAVVTCIRGFDPIYNVETVIRSIPLVMKEIPEVNFLIAGTNHDEDRIKKLAESLGVSAAINFCGDIPHDQLPTYLASSDIHVSASLSDGGVAVSTFEAMSSGVPVVVTNTGDNSIWIKDNVNGFVIPIKSPQQLAEKIIYLLHNPDTRKRFGSANRSIVEKKQNYYKEMEKVHVLYKNLVNG